MVGLLVLMDEAEVFETLLLRRGRVDLGARLLIRLTPSAADHAVDPAVQDVEALLGNPDSGTIQLTADTKLTQPAGGRAWTHVRGDAAPAAAGGGVQRLQFSDDFLQLGAEIGVRAGAQLGAEVFKAVDRDGFPGLKDDGKKKITKEKSFAIQPQSWRRLTLPVPTAC